MKDFQKKKTVGQIVIHIIKKRLLKNILSFWIIFRIYYVWVVVEYPKTLTTILQVITPVGSCTYFFTQHYRHQHNNTK
jgi:hypothetical protein